MTTPPAPPAPPTAPGMPDGPGNSEHHADERRAGALFALAAYVMWGVAPLYFVLVDFASPTEIIVHRVFWSLLLLLLILRLRGQLQGLRHLPLRVYRGLAVSGALLAINWWTFVWALQHGRVMETAVGYYINPLVTVLLGVLVLRERLRWVQWLALGLAACGVANELLNVGVFPIVALTLAFSFGFYGLVRKQLGVEPVQGLAVESALMLPIAGAALWFLMQQGAARGFDLGMVGIGYLALAGVVTMLPLLCFNAAALRLPLVVLGMFQYIAPSITLLLAVFYYGEPFTAQKALTFGFVWSALILVSIEGIYRSRVPYRRATP